MKSQAWPVFQHLQSAISSACHLANGGFVLWGDRSEGSSSCRIFTLNAVLYAPIFEPR
ncbi:MAG: hypothetical protein RMX54_01405 [Planktomarina sp.]|nr:hypothetical protein [Planktomarina sp.]